MAAALAWPAAHGGVGVCGGGVCVVVGCVVWQQRLTCLYLRCLCTTVLPRVHHCVCLCACVCGARACAVRVRVRGFFPAQIVPDLPPLKQKTVVQFLNEDATKRDWSDADMWFANSTCFDEAVRWPPTCLQCCAPHRSVRRSARQCV